VTGATGRQCWTKLTLAELRVDQTVLVSMDWESGACNSDQLAGFALALRTDGRLSVDNGGFGATGALTKK